VSSRAPPRSAPGGRDGGHPVAAGDSVDVADPLLVVDQVDAGMAHWRDQVEALLARKACVR
jgi:hypothetical protein